MRSQRCCFIVLFAAVSQIIAADEMVTSGLATGKDLPGAFQALCVVHRDSERQGKFHSPVTEIGLSPMVLVFVNDLTGADKNSALIDLLKMLDEAVARNADFSMGASVIALTDGGYREALEEKTEGLAKAIEVRMQEEQKCRKLGTDAGLKNVSLCLDKAAGPSGYDVNPKATVTVLVISKQKVQANFAFSKEKPLTAKDVEAIAAAVEKLTPGKKKPEKKKAGPARAT